LCSSLSCALCTHCCQFLWIAHSWLLLRTKGNFYLQILKTSTCYIYYSKRLYTYLLCKQLLSLYSHSIDRDLQYTVHHIMSWQITENNPKILTRFQALCTCVVDHCMLFCPFIFWPLYCMSFFD
jgi:hypothetical protein